MYYLTKNSKSVAGGGGLRVMERQSFSLGSGLRMINCGKVTQKYTGEANGS